jgi:hypothetical protein
MIGGICLADYPDWVLKHKKKGTYINYTNGKYYLYAAHSERIPGTKKVRRVSDGYIGRITREDGLIPARDKVSGDIIVFEYGLSMTAFALCKNIYYAFRREFKGNAGFVMVSGILSAIYGHCSQELYEQSCLSLEFPALNMGKVPTEKQKLGIERGRRMVLDILKKTFGDDMEAAFWHLAHVYKVKVNNRFYMSKISPAVRELVQKHGIDGEGFSWL